MTSETIVELYAAHPKTYDSSLLVLVQQASGAPGSTGAIPITDLVSLPSTRIAFGGSTDKLSSSTHIIFNDATSCLSIASGMDAASDSTAILKLESTTSLVYLTSLTTDQRTAITPTREGAITWDSDLNRLVVWSGGGYDVFKGMAYQDPDSVSISGGNANFTSLSASSFSISALDNTPIGSTTPSTAVFTSMNASSVTISGGSIDGVSLGAGTPGPGYFNLFTCKQRPFANMDWGLYSLSTTTVSYGSVVSEVIPLTSSFSGAPNVVCTATTGATTDANVSRVTVGVCNVSVSSFQVNVTISDPAGGSVNPVSIAWFAFE